MSMKALEWAMYNVPAEMVKGALLRILLLLADHADTQGKGAFPSQKRIVALTGYSRRTIQNGLHDLETAGLIRRGDQRIIPDYMEPIGVGLPADLLLRRPDIRSAERSVNAQAALVGASKSDWLPQVFLKGSVGYAAKDLKDLTHHKSMTYEIAPALSWTLFKGTQLVNATKLAKAQLDEAINQFNQTVLTAVQETDNAMNAYRNSIKQIVALREVRNQGQETLTLSLELYKQGLTPFQNVLDAQRSLLSYENQLVQARGYSLLQLIAMYQALGGGWSGNLNN